MTLAAIPEREDPRDALVGLPLADLKTGARSEPVRCGGRRNCTRWAAESIIETLRGNVDTRLRKLDEGQYDAIVLAAAGLRRLGWQDRIRELIPDRDHVPGSGPGRAGDRDRDDDGRGAASWSRSWITQRSRIAVTAERALLAALGGGCQVPIGGARDCSWTRQVHLRAIVASPDGARVMRG